MTKKDYILIANTIKGIKSVSEKNEKNGLEYCTTDSILMFFIEMLKNDNPKFNRVKFINFINKND